MKKVFVVLAMVLVFASVAFAQTQEEINAAKYQADRVEMTIDATIDAARFFNALYVKCMELKGVWDKENYGAVMDQGDIDATEHVGMPLARETSAVNQCYQFITWYTDPTDGTVKGEIDAIRNFTRD